MDILRADKHYVWCSAGPTKCNTKVDVRLGQKGATGTMVLELQWSCNCNIWWWVSSVNRKIYKTDEMKSEQGWEM